MPAGLLKNFFLAGVLLLVMTTAAQSQSRVPLVEKAGPPSPTQQVADRQEKAREIAASFGLNTTATGRPAVGFAGTTGVVALPDLTQTVPTTTEPQKLTNSIQILLLLSALTLAPSILLMTTCFTRIIIVMSLLRQALGAQQLPPNQILIGLSLFMTLLVMTPTWNKINEQAIVPYTNTDPSKPTITQYEAFKRAEGIMREFMITQIVSAHNEDDVYLFHSYSHGESQPQEWGDVETTALIPAFVLSELKVAFLMGFRIYLPFLIIDMVISSVLISIGMQLLPPVMVSLPFKLLLFVLVDGWHLVCGTLLASFG